MTGRTNAGGGVQLPALTNPAEAGNIQSGYQAINGEGEVVTGTYNPAATTRYWTKTVTIHVTGGSSTQEIFALGGMAASVCAFAEPDDSIESGGFMCSRGGSDGTFKYARPTSGHYAQIIGILNSNFTEVTLGIYSTSGINFSFSLTLHCVGW